MAFQHSAFDLYGLPAFFQDETLFSLSARYHILSGANDSKWTSQVLYGHHRAGLAHDWPSGLEHFVSITKGIYGTARQLIEDRTLLPFYLVRASRQFADNRRQELERGDTAHLKYRIGALTGGLRAHHPLRACPDCMRADREKLGVSYWHRSHQWPGVTVCVLHRVPLLRSTQGVNGVLRYQWQLPASVDFYQELMPKLWNATEFMDRLWSIAALANYWSTRLACDGVGRDLLDRICRRAMQDRGWLTTAGRLRLRYAAPELHAWLTPLLLLAPFQAFPTSEQAAAQFLTRIYSDRSYAHPLRHLVLLTWLFDNPSNLSGAIRQEWRARHRTEESLELAPDAAWRQRLLTSVCEHGISISAAATMHEVSVATAQRIVASAGYSVPRRPKSLTTEKKQEIYQYLLDGKTVDEVATSTDVSVPSINRLLAFDRDLKARWQVAAYYRKRRSYRGRWQRVLAKHPGLGLKFLRELEPAAYIWLYRHDRSWLKAGQKKLPVVPRPCGRQVDWATRDAKLANLVRRSGYEIVARQPGQRVRLEQLLRAIDDLHPSLARLDNLPHTRLALQAVTAPRRTQTHQGRFNYKKDH